MFLLDHSLQHEYFAHGDLEGASESVNYKQYGAKVKYYIVIKQHYFHSI